MRPLLAIALALTALACARKTDERNLIGCDAPGDVGMPPTKLVVNCSLL